MIRRSTLLFCTCLTTITFSFERARGVAADLTETQVVAQAAAPNASAVSVGSKGDNVKLIQERLKERGYYNGPLDGLYGADTQSAVKAFQQDAGFQATGQVDGTTWRRLGAVDLFSNSDSGGTNSAEPAATNASEDSVPEDGAAATAPPNDADAGEADAGEADAVAQANQAQANEAERAESATDQPTGGVGRLLWPSLALVAALSSFGIGFLLANRDKPSSEDEDAWGEAPGHQMSASPQVGTPKPVRTPLSNGSTAASIATTTATTTTALDAQTPVSETMRISKVNIVGELINDLQSNDPGKRRKAIWELGQRGDSSAVQSLVNQMTVADSKEKSLLLAALSEIGIRSLKPMNRALAIALQDENPEVRKNAIRDLTRIYDLVAQISQMLGHATEDEDVEVRQTAHWALEQLNRIRQVPEVRVSLQSLESSAKTPDFLPGEVSN
ncbi:MAG: peptidoglycan-binding protein [Cyanobacteria bacterium P01_A01_bin.114]